MKTCEKCPTLIRLGRVRYCDPCRDQAREQTMREARARYEQFKRVPKPKKRKSAPGIACATCAHGLPVAGAELGFACAVGVARTCSPLGPRRMWRER